MKKNKTAYVPLAVDILHSGHLNIINNANGMTDNGIKLFNIYIYNLF